MMRKELRRLSVLGAGAALAAALGATPAVAKDVPAPCGGVLHITDAPGDQAFRQQGITVVAMPASTDVLGVFYRIDGGKVNVNLVIADLAEAPPAGYNAVRYRAYVTVDGTVHFVQALVTASGVTYSTGSELEATYLENGTTEGALFPGKNGVIQMALPADRGGTPGTKLEAPSGTSGLLVLPVPAPGQLPPAYLQADTAPDNSEDGPETTPAGCAAPAPPAAAPVAVAKPKPARVSAKGSVSARKANSKRAATVTLKASEALTAVTVQLKRGKTVVGSAKLSRLSGSAAVKLKLKGKLKAGAHTLAVTARRADGSAFRATLKLKVGR